MTTAGTTGTRPLEGAELLRALPALQGSPASRVLRACGYVTKTGQGQLRSRPRAFVRAVVQARGVQPARRGYSVVQVVLWAVASDSSSRVKPQPRSELLALARKGINQYREALLQLAR